MSQTLTQITPPSVPPPLTTDKFEQATQLSYLTPEVWQAAQVFGADAARLAAQRNTMQSHALVQYYLDGWDYWFR